MASEAMLHLLRYETTFHLLFNCVYEWQVWQLLSVWQASQGFPSVSQRCPGNNETSERRGRSGSGARLGLQLPLAQLPLPGHTYLQRSPKPVQTLTAPTAIRAR